MAVIAQPPPIICSIIEEKRDGGVQLRGRVISQKKTQGHYSFRIVKSGPSGSSVINQGGPFSVSANSEMQVGFASFNLEPGADFKMELSLRIGDRTYNCARPDGDSR